MEGAVMGRGIWVKRSVVAAVCVGVAMVATPSWAEDRNGTETAGSGQLEWDLNKTAVGGGPQVRVMRMGDARTTGARYLEPGTPENRMEAAISGEGFVLVDFGRVKVFRDPVNVRGVPSQGTSWRWVRGDRLPVELTSMVQCPNVVQNWNCFRTNLNQPSFDLPYGADSGLYSSWESPGATNVRTNDGSRRTIAESTAAHVFADGLGSTVWGTVKLRTAADWVNTEVGLDGLVGTEDIFGVMSKGMYIGPQLPTGSAPENATIRNRTASVITGAWTLPVGVDFHQRTIVAYDCKGKEAGAEKTAVSIEKKYDCNPLGVDAVPNEDGKYTIRLSARPEGTVVLEDWLSVRGTRFEKGELPASRIKEGRDVMSGLTMEERERYIDEIPPMRFVTRAVIS